MENDKRAKGESLKLHYHQCTLSVIKGICIYHTDHAILSFDSLLPHMNWYPYIPIFLPLAATHLSHPKFRNDIQRLLHDFYK